MDTVTGLPVVGMIGGGQLARMTHQAAISLGLSLRVLASSGTESASLVAPSTLGEHTDTDAVLAFAAGCDVVTFDHEHVPGELIEALEKAGNTVHPGSAALRHAQDKAVMRTRLGAAGFPMPAWSPVSSLADVEAFAAEHGWPVVLKAVRGGYDGRGVWVCPDRTTARTVIDEAAAGAITLMVEELVPIRRELAALVARSPFGQISTWPIVETVQVDGICTEVVAPAAELDEERATAAQEMAVRIATEVGVVGLLAVELFDTGEALVVNELAMRPHNSGHWTIEGSVTSQFEQHLRAVLDYPLGNTEARSPVTVMANVLGGEEGGMATDERIHHLLAHDPALKLHWYGKAPRPGRKLGHVTVSGTDVADARARACAGADYLRTGTR